MRIHNLEGVFIMNKKIQISAAVLSIILLSGCGVKKDSIYQVSTIVELMRGKYDGNVTLKQLKKKSNFGVGTVNGLDGEFLFVNGKAYHLRGQVRAGIAKNFIKTPYAMVTKFKPEVENEIINSLDFSQFISKLDSMIDTQNMLTAIKVDGVFKNIKFRIVPVQQPPYRPLAEVMPDQREVEMQDLEGTLIGFYIPRYMAGINTPGYHFHFLSKDKKIGGHILDFTIQEGLIQLDAKNYFVLDLNEAMTVKHQKEKKLEPVQESNTEENLKEEPQKTEQRTEVVQKVEEKRESVEEPQNVQEKTILSKEEPVQQKEQPAVEPQSEQAIKSIDENDQAPVSPAVTEN